MFATVTKKQESNTISIAKSSKINFKLLGNTFTMELASVSGRWTTALKFFAGSAESKMESPSEMWYYLIANDKLLL